MTAATDVREAPEGVGQEAADPRRWRALVVTRLAAFMVLLDRSVR